MPTLFRLIIVLGAIFAAGYGTLYAVAHLVRPQERTIVEVVDLPRPADIQTGRSAADQLTGQASILVKPSRRPPH